MKAYIRIARIPLPTLIDMKALICIILKDLFRKLKLKIEANDGTRVILLGRRSKVKIIGFIFNALIIV